mgnify:CR=1 FL=1
MNAKGSVELVYPLGFRPKIIMKLGARHGSWLSEIFCLILFDAVFSVTNTFQNNIKKSFGS